MDLDIRLFEKNLIDAINSVGLPIEVKRLVVKDILQKIDEEANRVINNQIAEREKEETKE